MSPSRPFLVALLTLLAGGPLTAQEPDFTLHVPVEAQDLHPDVVEVGVRCVLAEAGTQTRLGTDLPGAGFFFSDRVPVSGSSFSQTLTVEMSFPGYTAAQKRSADTWSCLLHFGDGSIFGAPSAGAGREWLNLREGSAQLAGSLPSSG